MNTEYLTFRGVELRCFFERQEYDGFTPETGHYTVPGKWQLVDVEHKLESIFEVMGDDVICLLEREYNAKQHA